jgi:predicted ester cyclase
MTDEMTQETNKAVVRRLVEEVLGLGNMRLLDLLIAECHVSHFAIGDHYEAEGLRIHIDAYRAAMPNLTVRMDDLFSEGDRVARRFTLSGPLHPSSPAATSDSGESVVVHGIAIDRLVDGKIAESWVQIDDVPGWHPDRSE